MVADGDRHWLEPDHDGAPATQPIAGHLEDLEPVVRSVDHEQAPLVRRHGERPHLPARPAPNTFYGSFIWQKRIGHLPLHCGIRRDDEEAFLIERCSRLLLNQDVRGMRIYRTIYYLPAIVPIVASRGDAVFFDQDVWHRRSAGGAGRRHDRVGQLHRPDGGHCGGALGRRGDTGSPAAGRPAVGTHGRANQPPPAPPRPPPPRARAARTAPAPAGRTSRWKCRSARS